MNRGPQIGKARNGANDRSYIDKATEAFQGQPPDWIVALAGRADLSGLNGAAEAIGYSGALVSTVLRNVYTGDVGRVEQKVRGALLGLTVTCPVLGEMSRDNCLDWQVKPKAATSAVRMRLFHACRNNCPNFRPKGGTDAE